MAAFGALTQSPIADVSLPIGVGVWSAAGVAATTFGGAGVYLGEVWNADGRSDAGFVLQTIPVAGVWNADGTVDAEFLGQSSVTVVGPGPIVPARPSSGSYIPDIRLFQYTDFPASLSIDWILRDDGTIDDTQALATAVIVALGTNRLALSSDIMPDPDSSDRQGWWGDLEAEEIWKGWPIGCRLWLLKRAKITGPEAFGGATVTLVEMYIREALQPFLDLKIASQMDVQVARVGLERIDARVRLYRGPQTAVDLQYQILWDEITGMVTTSYAPQQIGAVLPQMIAHRR
jgi:phage gp46-like protein